MDRRETQAQVLGFSLFTKDVRIKSNDAVVLAVRDKMVSINADIAIYHKQVFRGSDGETLRLYLVAIMCAVCQVIDVTITNEDEEDILRAFTEKLLRYDDLGEDLYKWHPAPPPLGLRRPSSFSRSGEH
jgi:hypothetical protein